MTFSREPALKIFREIYGDAILKAFDKLNDWDYSMNLFRCAIDFLFLHENDYFKVYECDSYIKAYTKYSNIIYLA